MAAYPKDLAKAVSARWDRLVAGDYVTPECPKMKPLARILDDCFLAANTPEEGRYPRFNVVVTAKDDPRRPSEMTTYAFSRPRPLSVSELRRLAPATDAKKSAIWVTYENGDISIAGLADLGTSWYRARVGLSYSYKVPDKLIIQVDRPGRLKVFQGQYLVGGIADGELLIPSGVDISLFLHEPVHDGLLALADRFTTPVVERPEDYENFWFIALFNVFAAIGNSISNGGHGGLIVLLPPDMQEVGEDLRIKYPIKSDALGAAFVEFINARNETSDFWESASEGRKLRPEAFEAEMRLAAAADKLVESIRFVAQLSGCDGGIVMTADLKLLGFGAEIRAEMNPQIQVVELDSELRTTYEIRDGKAHKKFDVCDIEQFGMRHRAAIKLASKMFGVRVIAISQDGPISGVWLEEGYVLVRKAVSLINLNMPWS